MNIYPTTKLFYNKYIYKLRVKAELAAIFRGMNLAHAKEKLDEMQSYAETNRTIPSPFFRFRPNDTVSVETFMDTYTIYKALELNASTCSVRVERRCLDIYSNEKDWLVDLSKKIYTKGLWEPETAEIAEFLLDNNVDTVIKNKPIEWRFKCFLGKRVDPRFANFCRQNHNHVRIGKKALQSIEKEHWCEGFYFYTKTEKFLMLAKIAAGSSITKIVKFVNEDELA